jgi:hypothetical protein
MTYAVLSDVHANLEALQAVLAAARNEGVDRILCLGDLVGYHANPNEVLERLRIDGVHCLSGNHDQVAIGRKEPLRFSRPARRAILWTRQALSGENRDWLGGLPCFDRGGGPFLMVHAALHPEPNDETYLLKDDRSPGASIACAVTPTGVGSVSSATPTSRWCTPGATAGSRTAGRDRESRAGRLPSRQSRERGAVA